MEIGLKKGTVRVVPWNPEWPILFEQERKRLVEKIGNLVIDIQHVGSTSVQELSSKPVIDIAVAIGPNAEISTLRGPLESLGYIDRGDGGDNGGYLFIKESMPMIRTHHLHIVEHSGRQWRNFYLGFRDLLRKDEKVRMQYEALKVELGEKYLDDRKKYTEGKHHFIRNLLGYD